MVWDKNLIVSVSNSIKKIDQAISAQLAAVMHHEKFGKLEGTWRGLHYLVMNSETSVSLRLKLLNVSKDALSWRSKRLFLSLGIILGGIKAHSSMPLP